MTRIVWGTFVVLLLPLLPACSGCGNKPKEVDPGPRSSATSVGSASSASPPVAAADAAPKAPPLAEDAGAGFRGDFTMLVSSPLLPLPELLSFTILGDRIRYATPNRVMNRESVTLIDFATMRLYLLPDEQQSYIRIDLPPNASGPSIMVQPGPASLTSTGKKDKVANIPCEIWEGKGTGKSKATACVADGLPFVDYGEMAWLRIPPPPWMRAMTGGRKFPLRVVETDADGKERLKVEVTVVTTNDVNPAEFTIPANFKEVKAKMPGTPWRPGRPE